MIVRFVRLVAVSASVLCLTAWLPEALAASFLDQENADPVRDMGGRAAADGSYAGGQQCNSCCNCYDACDCCEPDCETYGRLDALFSNCPWVCPSDRCFDDFISPITNPFLFEDPRTVTEIQPMVIHQAPPNTNGGGMINTLAMPIRVALSDRLSLLVVKNGFLSDSTDLGILHDGWLDTSIGLKYNLMRDPCRQRLLSTGFTFEMPTGDTEALQGNGDGVFNLFASYGAAFGPCCHWITGSGFVLPTNTTDESQIWWWSNHFDRRIYQRGCLSVYALGEVNWYHYMKAGEDGPLPGVEGGDLINMGSPGVAGNDLVTGAFGTKIKPYGNAMEIGVAWESHLTSRRDLLEDRLTIDWILRF